MRGDAYHLCHLCCISYPAATMQIIMSDHLYAYHHTPEQYDRLVELLDALIDEIGEDEDHPLVSLMETLGTLIENYENSHFSEPIGDAVASLRHLMDEHNLGPTDLPEVGDEHAVSGILKRQKALNIEQIRALSKRFNISPAVFL